MLKDNKDIVVIYHRDCWDGAAAAHAAFLKFGDEAEYIPANYTDAPDFTDFKDKTVYILDFSYKREVFLELKNIAKEVIVLDHHVSAKEEIGDLVDIDLTKSGAVLAWEYFYPNEPIPHKYRLVQDRDLWLFNLEDTKVFSSYCGIYKPCLDSFLEVYDAGYEEIKRVGGILLEKHKAMVEGAAKNFRVLDLRDLVYGDSGIWRPGDRVDDFKYALENLKEVAVINAGREVASDALSILGRDYNLAISFNVNRDNISCSLRSNKDNPNHANVARIAKTIANGGGHVNAAGCALPLGCLKYLI